jgi:hypothetical protein
MHSGTIRNLPEFGEPLQDSFANPFGVSGPGSRSNHGLFRFRSAFLLMMACLSLVTTDASAARLQRWLYYSANLSVDSSITSLSNVLARASQSGYTHLLLAAPEFCRLADMDAHYFANINAVKSLAASLGIEIVPEVFPIGYSNDLLSQNPNLVEAMPVTDSLLVVTNGFAYPQPDPPVVFPGADFSKLGLWDFHDPTVVEDNGTAMVANPNGQSARIIQIVTVAPFRQYRISVSAKTQNFSGTPEIVVLGGGRTLTYHNLGVLQTQDWKTHQVVFNSLTNQTVTVYFTGSRGTTGTLWWDNASIAEVTFLNLVRRPGAPLLIRYENGPGLAEGVDYPAFNDPLLGVVPWKGAYDLYHTPPLLRVNATNGTRLRASWAHAVSVYNGQAMICPSEPATFGLLQDQAQRVHTVFGAKGYVMSHDEIRVMNWCPACQARNMDAGAMLANNVSNCIQILRQVNPGGRIYAWGDMFDPNHNAIADYYLVRGNLTNSWLGLDPAVTILPWYYDQRTNSLGFFSSRGHQQVMAGYYDCGSSTITNWLNTSASFPGVVGVMYTTWQSLYGDLEDFSEFVSGWEIQNSWQLGVSVNDRSLQLEWPTLSSNSYTIWRSTDQTSWQKWTNFTATAAIGRCLDTSLSSRPRSYYRVRTP